MALGHNWLSVHVYLNSLLVPLAFIPSFPQSLWIPESCWGSPFQSSLSVICRCQGTRCGLQTEFWSFQAREAGNPMGWQGKEGCWLLGERACGSNTWPAFCQKYLEDMMLPRIRSLRGTSSFRAEIGSKGSPKSYHNVFIPCNWMQER